MELRAVWVAVWLGGATPHDAVAHIFRRAVPRRHPASRALSSWEPPLSFAPMHQVLDIWAPNYMMR